MANRAGESVGAYGERVAVRYLLDQGMQILDRNWRCRHGEIDVVARDGETLVFCEVKTRRTPRCGTPLESVVRAKVRRLRRLAAQWMVTTGQHAEKVRFDVIGVFPQKVGPARLQHVREAF